MRKKTGVLTVAAYIFLIAFVLSAAVGYGGQRLPDSRRAAVRPPAATAAPSAAVSPSPTPAPTPTPIPVPTAPPAARRLDLSRRLRGTESCEDITDGDYMTYTQLRDSLEILPGGEAIGGLYLVWNEHVAPYELHAGDESVSGGEYGFLHEWIPLNGGAESVTISLPRGQVALCDIYAYSVGTPPDEVQQWEPPRDKADILIFPAHADDELVSFGGVIPTYADRGFTIQLAYMTSSYLGDERYRCHELLNAAWAAGARRYPVTTGFRDVLFTTADGAREYYGIEPFLNFQIEQLRRFRPSIVLGHDRGGEYGNGTHALAGETLEEAVIAAADPDRHTGSAALYGTWDTPKLYLHIQGDTVLDYETPLSSFGGSTAMDVALRAYGEHRSQQHWAFTVYSFDSPWDTHRFGLVRSLVGEDVQKNDLAENLQIGPS